MSGGLRFSIKTLHSVQEGTLLKMKVMTFAKAACVVGTQYNQEMLFGCPPMSSNGMQHLDLRIAATYFTRIQQPILLSTACRRKARKFFGLSLMRVSKPAFASPRSLSGGRHFTQPGGTFERSECS